MGGALVAAVAVIWGWVLARRRQIQLSDLLSGESEKVRYRLGRNANSQRSGLTILFVVFFIALTAEGAAIVGTRQYLRDLSFWSIVPRLGAVFALSGIALAIVEAALWLLTSAQRQWGTLQPVLLAMRGVNQA